jgi:hypothetical protein
MSTVDCHENEQKTLQNLSTEPAKPNLIKIVSAVSGIKCAGGETDPLIFQ